MNKEPFLQRMPEQPDYWDPYSCQPYTLKSQQKPRKENLSEYVKVAASNLLGLPAIAYQYLALTPQPCNISPENFIGLSIEPDYCYVNAIKEMLEELGVKQLLMRIPAWQTQHIEHYVKFMAHFPDQKWVINILQSRDSVADLGIWRQQVDTILQHCTPFTRTFWIGNAINRTKWGCRNTKDYLLLQEKVELLRDKYKNLTLLGSSIIDFEPLLSWRTLFNFHRYRLEANAALLYVNRRHSPYGTQYKIFDLHNKLRLAKAMTKLSNRCDNRLWITETNWPLLNTKPYTPNSGNPTRTVDEATQAKYLTQYYQIAWHSGWVEKVFWWQLINPGYGLIDHRKGALRKLPSYYAFKALLQGQLSQDIIK